MISIAPVILLLWVKVLFLTKKHWFSTKNADINKIKRALVLKGLFCGTTFVCLLKYQIPSFWHNFSKFQARRWGRVILPSPLPPQNKPLKRPPRLALTCWRSLLFTNQKKRKYRFKVSKWFKSFYWILKSYGCKQKILIVFVDMIADMLNNKSFNSMVTELFSRRRKLNISLVFITQSYIAVPKNIRLILTRYFVMKLETKENFSKLHLTIHQILTLKTFWIFIKSVLQNHSLFWLLILLLHQITLHVSERIF